MDVLKRAAAMLRQTAEALKECSTIDGDWWSEREAKREFERLIGVAAELERMAQAEPVNQQMLEALKELRDAYQEFMGVPAVKANAAIAAAEESLTVERRAAPVNQQMLEALNAAKIGLRDWEIPENRYKAQYAVDAAIAAAEASGQENHQAEPVAGQCKFSFESVWRPCSVEHHYHVLSCQEEWPGYETRLLYTAPQPSSPPGWKLVPVEPTSKMIVAGAEADPQFFTHAQFVYRAMLAAVPEQEGGAE